MIEDQGSVLFVSTYPPRECGIATFTRDLANAIEKKFLPYLSTKVLAMNSNGVNMYNYPQKTIYQLSDNDRKSYKKIAQKINRDKSIKIVIVQHEFGIFGGDYGKYLIDFLKELKKPKILNFHSILPRPEEDRVKIVRSIAKYVDEILVMTPKGVDILRKKYGLTTPIRVIPHGIPTVSFERQKAAKKSLGFENKTVLFSFGMMSVNKSYEHVIKALPEVVKKYPNLVYIILGATHPNIIKHEGEVYRNSLIAKVKKLGLENNVKFYNKYVDSKEIIQFLKACDVYVCSSFTPEQITSGTLSYAMGCGRAVVSTPFLHAQDLVQKDRGILVDKFRNSKSFTKALLEILSDKKKLREMEMNNYEFTRKMTWPNVALAYGEIIREHIKVPDVFFEKLPEINVSHVKRMTDDFGMVQFAKYSDPDWKSGYTLDDNARALVVAAELYSKFRTPSLLKLVNTYFDYLKYVQDEDGRFYSLVSKDKKLNEGAWSEDSQGRAIETVGYLSSVQAIPNEIKKEAREMVLKALPNLNNIHAPRALSFAIKGLYYFNKENYSEEIIKIISKFADELVGLFEENSEVGWEWFEKELTYVNSKMCESLFYAYMVTRKENYLDVAVKSLNFLASKTFEKGVFVPIGQNGWFKKDGERAYFDQQPVDTTSMLKALTLAYKVTRNSDYEKKALATFQWFFGKNTLKQMVYDEKTGGCYDGFDESAANLNQGAESTLAYLSARLEVENLA